MKKSNSAVTSLGGHALPDGSMTSTLEMVSLHHSDLPPHPFQSTIRAFEAALVGSGFVKIQSSEARREYAPYKKHRRNLAMRVTSEGFSEVLVPVWVRALAIITLHRAYQDTVTDEGFDSALSAMQEGLLVLQASQEAQEALIPLLALWRLGRRDTAWRRTRSLIKKAKAEWQKGH